MFDAMLRDLTRILSDASADVAVDLDRAVQRLKEAIARHEAQAGSTEFADFFFGNFADGNPDRFDPYSELGVARTAARDEVKRAYRKEAMRRHPDHGGSQEAIVRLNLAYLAIRKEKGWI